MLGHSLKGLCIVCCIKKIGKIIINQKSFIGKRYYTSRLALLKLNYPFTSLSSH